MFLVLGFTVLLSSALLYLRPLAYFFELRPLSAIQLAFSAGIGFVSVGWFEGIKWIRRKRK